MSDEDGDGSVTYSGYQANIFWAFNTLGDFLWKSPQFIAAETEIEREKLWSYFPDEGTDEQRARNADLRRRRAALEASNLFGAFPVLIAQSNLFLTLATFEQHAYHLALTLEVSSEASLSTVKGRGIERCLAFFRLSGVQVDEVQHYPEILAAITLRNGLLHAGGNLLLSRHAPRIRQIAVGRLYMDKVRRTNPKEMLDEQGRREVEIIDDHVVINYHYPMRVASYCRKFLLDLTAKIPAAL